MQNSDFKFPVFLLVLLACFSACDNTLDIIEEKEDIPVVYGFLSLSDTAQYIRVERAFVDANTSALELAQNPDSLYYPDLRVTLRRNSTDMAFELERVDGNLEGYEREPGAFAQSPNYLYKILTTDIVLEGEESYTLEIRRNNNEELLAATTVLLGQTQIRRPDPVTANVLDFDYVDRTRFIWQASGAARIHNLFIDFNYRERNPQTGGNFVARTVRWQPVQNLRSSESRVDVEIDGFNFYTFLAGSIPVDDTAERRFEDLTVTVVSGGEEIESFVSIGAANLGITSTQDVPVFSNIPGGRGIFSSTNTDRVENISLSNPSRDSLRNGVITRELNFTN